MVILVREKVDCWMPWKAKANMEVNGVEVGVWVGAGAGVGVKVGVGCGASAVAVRRPRMQHPDMCLGVRRDHNLVQDLPIVRVAEAFHRIAWRRTKQTSIVRY